MAQNPVTDLTMLASTTFDCVISQIRDSCLNFSMQVTPFSALISLRKSFVTDTRGTAILPKNQQKDIVISESAKKERYFKNDSMEEDLRIAVEKIQDLERKVMIRDYTIASLNIALEKSKESTEFLSKELSNSRKIFEDEKSVIFNDHIEYVTTSRKELQDMDRKHQNLLTKLEMLEVHTEVSSLKPDVIDAYIKPETLSVGFPGCRICKICDSKPTHSYTEYFEKQGIDDSYKVCRPCNSDYFSLTAHWLSPPDFLLNGEISSLRSHYVTLLNHMDEDTGDVLVGTGKVARNKNVTIFDKYEQEYQETCRQS